MSVIVNDLLCQSCSLGNCKNHKEKISIVDEITGLVIDVICACSNHPGGKM